ncbi:MAG: hypothetical protein AB7N73_05430 [Gemmatimonadales bacterium]
MRPAPSWFPVAFLVLGLVLILPIIVAGMLRGTLLRSLGVASALAAMWTAFYLFYTRIGIPPVWAVFVVQLVVWTVVIWRAWPTIGPMLGFRGTQAP